MSGQRQHDKRRKPEPEEFRLKVKSKTATVPFLKITHTMYIHNLIKNLFDFALVRLK